MLAFVSAAPFADVSVELGLTTYNSSDKTATNPSKGITPADKTIAFSTKVTSGYLSFTCSNDTATSPTLTYKMTGTDLKSFALSTTKVTITTKAKEDFKKDAKVTWAMNADGSNAPSTAMKGTCPDMGNAYGWFAPVGTAAPASGEV